MSETPVTLDLLVRQGDWLDDGWREGSIHHQVENELRLYVGRRHALPIWRAFLAYRRAGMPIPERLLAVFEKWAIRLAELYRTGPRGLHRPSTSLGAFERHHGKPSEDEYEAILQVLDLKGTKKIHKSFALLREAEERRHVAAEIHQLHEAGLRLSEIATRLSMPRWEVSRRHNVFYRGRGRVAKK